MSSIEEMEEIKNKLRNMPALALIDNLNELIMDEDVSVEVLKLFKDEMIRRRFNSPFGFLVNISKEEGEVETDRKKQLSYFRKLAMLKKYSLFSTMISIASRKIREYAKKNGYYDLIQYLPINGNYLENILKYDYFGLVTYRKLYDVIKSSGDKKEAILYEIEGETYVYNKKLPKEKKIEDHLNKGEKVVSSKKSVISKPIINNRFTAKSICSAIVGYSGEVSFKEALSKQGEELSLYNSILKNRGYIPFNIVDAHLDRDKYLKKDLENSNLLENGVVKKSIKEAIIKKRAEIIDKMDRMSKLMFVIPIAKHYLLKNKVERKRSPLYPGLALNPSKQQLKVLGIANEHLGFALDKAVEEKLNLEDYGDNKIIAYATVAKSYGVKNASKFFKVEEDKIVESLNTFTRMQRGRGKDFLERLKG